jgi:single-strand DNA-binding protein
MSINKVILVGHVGKDPVVRYFDKGVAKASFPLATSESYTNQQGETITSTEWHNIVLWRSLAEVAEKTVKKGTQLYIVGKIKTRSYVDKDGVNKYITEILGDTMMTLEKKQPAAGYQAEPAVSDSVNEPAVTYNAGDNAQNNPSAENSFPGQSEDDLPF